jgi:hypothetical protein
VLTIVFRAVTCVLAGAMREKYCLKQYFRIYPCSFLDTETAVSITNASIT